MAIGLRKRGYVVDQSADGEDGLWRAEAGEHDVVVLDLGLPKMNGMVVLDKLRQNGCTITVWILTARDSVDARVVGLNAGAVVSRTDIETRIYDDHVEPNSNVVDAAISILRKAIDKTGTPSRIETRRGEGCRLRVQ